MPFRLMVPVAVCVLLAGGAAAGRPITLAEALDAAARGNLDLRASEAQAHVARFLAHSALAEVGPRLHLDANVYEWNSPFSISIGGMPFLVRQDLTSMVTISGTKPIVGLFSRIERYRGQAEERRAAGADVEAASADVRLQTVEAYLQLAEADDLVRIAGSVVGDAEEQVARARSLVGNGRLLEADALRMQVALAQARQDLLAAEGARESRRAVLAAVLGMPVDSELETERLDLTDLPPLPGNLADALALAARGRPEIRAAAAHAAAARDSHRAAIGDLLPSVDVVGAYQHSEGQTFFPRDAGYVEGLLSWDFFGWGARYEASRAERGRAQLAAIKVEQVRRDVAVEVARRFVEARTARAAVDVARSAVGQADEAYRVARVLYDNGRATTTDLLDAQLARERTQMSSIHAAYGYLIARAALERATAASPVHDAKPPPSTRPTTSP